MRPTGRRNGSSDPRNGTPAKRKRKEHATSRSGMLFCLCRRADGLRSGHSGKSSRKGAKAQRVAQTGRRLLHKQTPVDRSPPPGGPSLRTRRPSARLQTVTTENRWPNSLAVINGERSPAIPGFAGLVLARIARETSAGAQYVQTLGAMWQGARPQRAVPGAARWTNSPRQIDAPAKFLLLSRLRKGRLREARSWCRSGRSTSDGIRYRPMKLFRCCHVPDVVDNRIVRFVCRLCWPAGCPNIVC
jgi:hypothetical protein